MCVLVAVSVLPHMCLGFVSSAVLGLGTVTLVFQNTCHSLTQDNNNNCRDNVFRTKRLIRAPKIGSICQMLRV
jgi:hypothetical protein